jgi:propionyl-CoA carboxylase alpha chain
MAYSVRNDAGVREGDEISMYYDPMISKLCAWAPTRLAAIDGMGRALEDFHIEGPVPQHPVPGRGDGPGAVPLRGTISTNYIKDEFPDGFKGVDPDARPGRHPDRRRARPCSGSTPPAPARPTAGLSNPVRTDWIVAVGPAKRRVALSGRRARTRN